MSPDSRIGRSQRRLPCHCEEWNAVERRGNPLRRSHHALGDANEGGLPRSPTFGLSLTMTCLLTPVSDEVSVVYPVIARSGTQWNDVAIPFAAVTMPWETL